MISPIRIVGHIYRATCGYLFTLSIDRIGLMTRLPTEYLTTAESYRMTDSSHYVYRAKKSGARRIVMMEIFFMDVCWFTCLTRLSP